MDVDLAAIYMTIIYIYIYPYKNGCIFRTFFLINSSTDSSIFTINQIGEKKREEKTIPKLDCIELVKYRTL